MKTADEARESALIKRQVETKRANRDAIRKIEASIERAIEHGKLFTEVHFEYDHKFDHEEIKRHFNKLGYKVTVSYKATRMYDSDTGITVNVSW